MSDEAFLELKKAAVAIWMEYSDDFGYRSSKINLIEPLQNVADNGMYIIAMFDVHNQTLLAQLLSAKTRLEIRKRLLAGGAQLDDIVF